MKSHLYISHLKNFVENENLTLSNFDNLIKEKENQEKDSKKLKEVRSTLSTSCRIIKIQDEEIEISKWNLLKSTKINEIILNSLIEEFNFKTLLPCQSCVLEYSLLYKNGSNSLLNGDIYIEVPTGLGKTLCYIISILDYFLYKKEEKLFCLILTATDELVNQILNVIRKFDISNLICKSININMFHSNVYFDEFIDNCNSFKDCNIIVTTTSKFEMLFYNNEKMFKDLKFLIIDEVDKILTFNRSNINRIVNSLTSIVETYQCSTNYLYKPKYFLQKILVSATLCKVADNIMSLNLYRPIFFYYIINYKRNEEFYFFTKNKCCKLYFLIKLVKDIQNKDELNMLIFCENEESSHELFRYLTVYFSYINENCYSIKEYSRNLSNKKKKKILNEFLNKKLNILICTDAISRGLDTINLNFVVNFDMPKHYNVLTHRIGRLSRCNSNKGTVYHFIKKYEKLIIKKSAKQRNVKLIKQIRFKKNLLVDIQKSILHIKPLIKNAIKLESKEIIKCHKYYSYDDLMKL